MNQLITIEVMENRLKEQYPNCKVVVLDLTGNNNHFEVRISEPSFEGLPRIQQHKKVMDVFANELASGEIHALSIKTIKI